MFDGLLSRTRRFGSAAKVLRLLVILSAAGPALALILLTLQSRALLLDDAARRATRMSELLAQHAASAFDTYNLAFSRIEEHLANQTGPIAEEALHTYLAGIDHDVPSIDGIVAVDGDGMTAAQSRSYPTKKTYVGDRDYVRDLALATAKEPAAQERAEKVLGRDGLFIGPPFKSRITGRIVLVASRARKDPAGSPGGAIAMTLSQSYFEEVYRTLATSKRDRVALVRADSRVLAQVPAPPGRPSVDPDQPGGPYFARVASADPKAVETMPEGIVDYVSPVDDVRRISGFRKLDGYPLYVEVGYSVDALLAPWRRQVAANAIIAALVTLVLFGLARLALRKMKAEADMQALVLAETHQRGEAEAALRQAQKMEALGQLTGGIAHDFNNVLNVVLVNLELAAKRLHEARAQEPQPTEPSKVEGHVHGAIQGAERGVALTRRLLAFAERQSSEPERLRVSQLVFGVLELLGQAAGSRVRITLDCPRTLPPIIADANAFETALLNLVVNARDAMPEGGRVHIAAREEAGRFVVVAVSDTGSGMPPEMIARAAEPFFTTKGSGKGSGLGLAMVERFATHAGGRIAIRSRQGEGTSVEIWLPAAQPAAPTP